MMPRDNATVSKCSTSLQRKSTCCYCGESAKWHNAGERREDLVLQYCDDGKVCCDGLSGGDVPVDEVGSFGFGSKYILMNHLTAASAWRLFFGSPKTRKPERERALLSATYT